jgi:hypothetical protein
MHEARDFHVVIVVGGVIGQALARFTLQQPAFRGRVSVIGRDPGCARAWSALSASPMRKQLGTTVNVEISRYGIAFLRDAADLLAVDGVALGAPNSSRGRSRTPACGMRRESAPAGGSHASW